MVAVALVSRAAVGTEIRVQCLYNKLVLVVLVDSREASKVSISRYTRLSDITQ